MGGIGGAWEGESMNHLSEFPSQEILSIPRELHDGVNRMNHNIWLATF